MKSSHPKSRQVNPAANLRFIAATVINAVTDGASLTDCLEPALIPIKDKRDRGLVKALCYGVCRFYTHLDIALSYLLKKPLRGKDGDLHALLLVGLYQLMMMRIPEYAAVTETVNATELLNKPWSRSLANAVLREYLRNKEAIEKQCLDEPEAKYAHPLWWIKAIEKNWPEQAEAIFAANNAHPPLALRVNQKHLRREEYLERLSAEQQEAHLIPETQNGLILQSPIAAEELPGFLAGDVSVQDGGAQLAAELLELAPQLSVLDACAAPGGKLTHILEIEPTVEAVAVEKDKKRCDSIHENLTRLKLQATCICQDANAVQTWWNKKLFDRILIDAPCSASGVVRRHPDIKLLRQPSDIKAFTKQQTSLLDSLWPLLKPGGLLVYATCSIFPEENTQVLAHFFAKHTDASEEKILANWGIACQFGRQILPGMHEMDGFYYVKVRKKME